MTRVVPVTLRYVFVRYRYVYLFIEIVSPVDFFEYSSTSLIILATFEHLDIGIHVKQYCF